VLITIVHLAEHFAEVADHDTAQFLPRIDSMVESMMSEELEGECLVCQNLIYKNNLSGLNRQEIKKSFRSVCFELLNCNSV
jgi:hypothetical protein